MKRTNAYIVTLDRDNLDHAELFRELRLITYLFNKSDDANFRVQRVGRLGVNNPNAVLYSNNVDGRRYQKIRVNDASRYDIYLYDRAYINNRDKVKQSKLNKILKDWAFKTLSYKTL